MSESEKLEKSDRNAILNFSYHAKRMAGVTLLVTCKFKQTQSPNRCSVINVFWKFFRNSQENTCDLASSLILLSRIPMNGFSVYNRDETFYWG